jgi:orotate phosphoribosyltransferase
VDKSRDYLLAELGKAFLKTEALRIGDFTTSAGTRTPFYIDLRRAPSFPNVLSLAVDCLKSKLSEITVSDEISFECFFGVPITGLIFTSILSRDLEKPLIYSSKEATHRIAGILRPGARVLIVDDVSETGISIENAAQAIRANSGIATDALTLIDRLEGASETLANMGVKLSCFTTTQELAKTLQENLALSDEEIELVEASRE